MLMRKADFGRCSMAKSKDSAAALAAEWALVGTTPMVEEFQEDSKSRRMLSTGSFSLFSSSGELLARATHVWRGPNITLWGMKESAHSMFNRKA
jgi:hypothetical protein